MKWLVPIVPTMVLAWAPAAYADDDGLACETSTECSGGLHCIDGTCAEVVNGKVRAHALPKGSTAMIGDGHGYVAPIVVADLLATATSGLFIALSFMTGSGWFALASLFPTTLTGPIIHAANGRAGPAVISFFAWASGPPSTLGVAFLGGISTFNGQVAVTAGVVMGVVCAAGFTALDAYFARPVKTRASSFTVMPAMAPTRDGLSASLVGTF